MLNIFAILIATLTVVGLVVGAIFWIRHSAEKYSITDKRWWVFVPANTGALVVGKQNTNVRDNATGTVVRSGGPVFNLIHGIPGKKRKKISPDPMAWQMIEGEEDWGFWHWITGGAFFLGPWREIRVCTINELRYTKTTRKNERGEDEDVYGVESRTYDTLFPFFSGALAVDIKGAEAKGTFTVDIGLNFLWERTYFVRSVLRVADANAIITIMANARVVAITGTMKPEEILAGKQEVKEKIAKAVDSIIAEAEEQIGLSIFDTEVYHLDVNAKERALFELAERTKREQKARVQVAQAERRMVIIAKRGETAAQLLQAEMDKKTKVIEGEAARAVGLLANDVSADYVKRAILPVAKAPGGPAIRMAEAIEKTNIQVLTLGADHGQIIDLGALREKPAPSAVPSQ